MTWPAITITADDPLTVAARRMSSRLVRRLGRHLAGGAPQPDQLDDLRATLYGRDAVLTLHFAQEEESYFSLARD